MAMTRCVHFFLIIYVADDCLNSSLGISGGFSCRRGTLRTVVYVESCELEA